MNTNIDRKEKCTNLTSYSLLKILHQRGEITNISANQLYDYQKAFDVVSHDILLQKLKYYGCDTKSLLFF